MTQQALEKDTEHQEPATAFTLLTTHRPPGEEAPPRTGTDVPRRLSLLPSPAPTDAGVPPAAATAARTSARAIVEALLGLRPVAHLAPACDLSTYEKLRRRIRWESEAREQRRDAAETRQGVSVIGCHAQRVPGGVEASATFAAGGRARAVSFRLEPRRERWRLVALEIG